jgi:hypothetical protein
MKALLILATLGASTLTMFAPPLSYYVAGDFNGWDPAGNLMTETAPGSGIYTATINFGANERHEFKITQGTWSWNTPSTGNSWLYSGTVAGSEVITYDSTTHADGWNNAAGRIGVSYDPGTWTAVGDWEGWNNGNPATVMQALGGGIYGYEQLLAPGNYQYKAVKTGSWDAIGSDARSINANNLGFTVTADEPLAVFKVDALNGAIYVDTVPEPSQLWMVAGGALAALGVWGKRRFGAAR